MTSIFPDIAISTERLTLRAYEDEDVPALAQMMDDEAVGAWLPGPLPYTEDDARAWVGALAPAERTGGRGIVFAVTEFLTQRLVGTVRLQHTDWSVRSAEVSYL